MHTLNPRALIGIAAVLAVLAVAGLLAAQPWWANLAHAQDSPSAAVELSAGSVAPGTAITATMSFSNLEADTDTSTTDYIFRADVVGADACEGDGMGVDRYFYKVDEDPETRGGTVSADCPAGDYTVRVTLSSADNTELDSASAGFTIAEPAPEPTPTPEPTPEPESAPSVAIALSPSDLVEEGETITATMSFSGLEADSDTETVDYIFRADVLDDEAGDADGCEGGGVGVDRNFNKVDEDPEIRTATVSADCPAGDYTVRVALSSADNTELDSATAGFTIAARAPGPESAPSVGIELSPTGSLEPGTEITVTMTFGGLEADSDASTLDYVFRADVKNWRNVDADGCEGGGMGADRNINQADEDPETRTATVSAGCPEGGYTVQVTLSSAGGDELATATAGFSLIKPVELPSLTALSLSQGDPAEKVALSPAFDGATLEYDAETGAERITVTATAGNGATIAYRDGSNAAMADTDTGAEGHQVDLAPGANTVKVAVSNNGLTTNYVMEILRLVAPQ